MTHFARRPRPIRRAPPRRSLISNNASELNLRRQAVGRKDWIFVGSADGGRANAVFTSLLGSCRMVDVEP